MEKKERYEGNNEEDITNAFIETLEKKYSYTPEGVGNALAFLYVQLDNLRRQRK